MTKKQVLKYRVPDDWFVYDAAALMSLHGEAQAAVAGLTEAPFRRTWLESSGEQRVRAEVAGTCRLGGLTLTEAEIDRAMSDADGGDTATRAELRARAAARTYRWIGALPGEMRVDAGLLSGVHRRLTAGAGGDPGAPGNLRIKNEQVFFGNPLQRGAKGGRECHEALAGVLNALASSREAQSPLVRSFAFHYHVTSIHPFAEANGRTARALETILRQAAGLGGHHFVSMADYYFGEQKAYLDALSAARRAGHDLTPFLDFALRGLTLQCRRLSRQVREHIAVALFEDTATRLFAPLRTGKRQAMAERQVQMLRILIDERRMAVRELYGRLRSGYANLRNPWKAFMRDTSDLLEVGAVRPGEPGEPELVLNLAWPSEIGEAEFFGHYTQTPRSGAALSGLHIL